MDEIALLQQQLAAVQQQESALKLSEHNVIDLLQKLQQSGKIQIVHTLTGKQFLTPLQIQHEIQDYVTLNAGRMSLTALQQAINIDRTYVDKYVQQLASKSHTNSRKGGSGIKSSTVYYIVNNGEEVLTNWYLDAIMEDTNALLQESGTCTFGDLAQQYEFAVDYMKEVVLSRLGTILQAQERGNVLYTNSFVESQRAQIRGVFAAITRPTFVPDIVRRYKFDEKVVDECLSEFVQSRVMMGVLRGREYIPYVFITAQRENMYSFFQQNGYLDNARANQLQVAKPFEFLKKRFPEAIPLKDCVVNHTLLLQIEGSIDAAVNDSSFVDIRSVLPSAIPQGDMGSLLGKSPLVGQGFAGVAHQIADVYAVSKAFVNNCIEKFKEDASTKASNAARHQRTVVNVAKAQNETSARGGDANEDEDDDDYSGKRGKKGGKKAAKVIDDEKNSGKKGKRGVRKNAAEDTSSKSKTGKGKKGKKSADVSAKRMSSTSTEDTSIVPSREEAFGLISVWFPSVEDDEELLDGLMDYLESEVDRIYTSALTAALSNIMRGDAASLRELRKKFEDQFDHILSMLLVYEKGFNKLDMHVDSKDQANMEQLKVVEEYLLDTSGVELAALVTRFVAESNNLEMDGVPPFTVPQDATEAPTTTRMTSLSDENRKLLEKNLSPSTASALVRLWTFAVAGRRSLSDFMAHINILTEELSIPLRKVDRKKERQIIFGYRHEVIAALEDIDKEQYTAVAALILQLFFQQCTGFPATFPRNHVSYGTMLLNAFRSSVPEQVMASLQAFVDAALQPPHEQWLALLEDARALVLAKDFATAE